MGARQSTISRAEQGDETGQGDEAGLVDVSRKNNDRKRIRPIETPEEERERLEEENLHTPKRKKMMTTSAYIYETLFINGENSDITIVALGQDWKLHKVYLKQSTYFSSMFSGSWKEATESVIRIDIPDENIDVEALKITFGSLYRDDVAIAPTKVIPVLATASLLGLDGLIEQCANVMIETLCCKTVCTYYKAAKIYSQDKVSNECIAWLLRNLMTLCSPQVLHEINPELMLMLVENTYLFVMQVEMDVYSMLKKWTFLNLNKHWCGTDRELKIASEDYWNTRALTTTRIFLDSAEGEPFLKCFAALRYEYMITDYTSAKCLESNKIIPHRWLLPVYKQQWLQMLKVEQGVDQGPTNAEQVRFEKRARRCGRVLYRDTEHCWRWTGFNYSLDLLFSYSNRLLSFKRNIYSQRTPGGVILHDKKDLLFKATITSHDALGHTTYTGSTEVKHLVLSRDEEHIILKIEPKVKFPLHVSCQFLVYTPGDDFEEVLKIRCAPRFLLPMAAAAATRNNTNSCSNALEGSKNIVPSSTCNKSKNNNIPTTTSGANEQDNMDDSATDNDSGS